MKHFVLSLKLAHFNIDSCYSWDRQEAIIYTLWNEGTDSERSVKGAILEMGISLKGNRLILLFFSAFIAFCESVDDFYDKRITHFNFTYGSNMFLISYF